MCLKTYCRPAIHHWTNIIQLVNVRNSLKTLYEFLPPVKTPWPEWAFVHIFSEQGKRLSSWIWESGRHWRPRTDYGTRLWVLNDTAFNISVPNYRRLYISRWFVIFHKLLCNVPVFFLELCLVCVRCCQPMNDACTHVELQGLFWRVTLHRLAPKAGNGKEKTVAAWNRVDISEQVIHSKCPLMVFHVSWKSAVFVH